MAGRYASHPRRTPRSLDKPTKLGEHPTWEYGAFVTNTPSGQIQFLDARHRTQAHVEDRIKQFKACGARNLSTKTLRFRIPSALARLISHARRRILKIPPGWRWSRDLAAAWDRLKALHPA